MSKEAMKLALEALEEPHPGVRTNFTDALKYRKKIKQAITALREAQAEQPVLWKPEDHYQDGWRDALQSVQKTLAQQEPVGDEWTPCMKLPVVVHVRKQRPGEAHVSTREGITPVKPDDLIMRGVSGEEYPIGRAIFEQTYSLDTSPPPPAQRTWVGLTDEDIRQCSRDVVAGGPENSVDRFAYAIEAKLKEKNT